MDVKRTKLGLEWRAAWQSAAFQAALRNGIARMRPGDEWPFSIIIGAQACRDLHADPKVRAKMRRCIGGAFKFRWRDGHHPEVEPVPESRRPTLWRLCQSR